MKTGGGDAFIIYNILCHYFKILKIRPKYKNGPIVNRSTSQANEMVLDACMKFENYPIKTVGEDLFSRHYISYNYFINFKNNPIVIRGTSQVGDIILVFHCMIFENYPIKSVGGDAFYSYYILYHYFKFKKKKSPKIQK